MKILLILKVRRGAGALAGVAECLNSQGFYIDEHKLVPRGETAEIRVIASGDGSLAPLRDRVAAVNAVIELVEIRETGESEAPAPPPPNPWVERLVRRWPDILPVLKEYSAPLGGSECEHDLTCLGVDTGAVMYSRRPLATPPKDLETGLSRVVAPAVAELARIRVKGNTLRVTETELASSEQVDLLFLPVEDKPYCCFLSGLVTGMLNAVPGVPRVRVEETRCLARGDHVCDFKVMEIG